MREEAYLSVGSTEMFKVFWGGSELKSGHYFAYLKTFCCRSSFWGNFLLSKQELKCFFEDQSAKIVQKEHSPIFPLLNSPPIAGALHSTETREVLFKTF